MTEPNTATLWGTILVEELASNGVNAACVSPGSRSTPLTVAFDDHPDVEVYSHLDERSAAYFALGRARRTGEPTALVCTSGTAPANYHPAVLEADRARVPLLVLTADRPAELRDSGANQTVDQVKLYGDAVRWYAELPHPRANDRRARMLRTTAARALAAARSVGVGGPPGPVHLNCPFRKPLEPTSVSDSVPDAFDGSLGGSGRDGPFVQTDVGVGSDVSEERLEALVSALSEATRPLLVAGPDDPVSSVDPEAVRTCAAAVGAPVLADPLSELRFGPHVDSRDGRSLVCGGYDVYAPEMADPDVVVRFGASPTSKRLRERLREADARQYLLDPVGDWREATFTATDLLTADPGSVFSSLAERLGTAGSCTTGDVSSRECDAAWVEWFERAESTVRSVEDEASDPNALSEHPFEGAILSTVFDVTPEPATLFVSNSMPIRDADRFATPTDRDITVLGNRGASGIDGITSSALGAGVETDDDEPLVCVLGDLAFYHDANGLLGVDRCGVDATFVVVDNDGGGIFHMLPIESFDPPFTGQFKTPHGIDFEPLAETYGLAFVSVEPADFEETFASTVGKPGARVIHVTVDAETSHRRREELERRVVNQLPETIG